MRAFATDVLGLRLLSQDREDFVELELDDGAKFELFASSALADASTFESNPVVAGFLVDDIRAARHELAQTPDVTLLGELCAMPDGYAWQAFRAPDGHVYELVADPSAAGRG